MAEDKKPYIAPNGLHVVKLTTHRFGIHNPGEVAGFEEKTAAALVEKGWAVPFTPSAEVIAKHDNERAEANQGKPVAAKAAPPPPPVESSTTESKKPPAK